MTHTITVRVTDDGNPALSASRTFRITVREVDNAPMFEPVGVQAVDEGVAFALALVARDTTSRRGP